MPTQEEIRQLNVELFRLLADPEVNNAMAAAVNDYTRARIQEGEQMAVARAAFIRAMDIALGRIPAEQSSICSDKVPGVGIDE